MTKTSQLTMGDYTKWFWDSLNDHQRAFLSLTQNHRKYFPCGKNWDKLTKYQQKIIFDFIWRGIKPKEKSVSHD